MSTLLNFLSLLWMSGFKKRKYHKTYRSYLRHAWKLAKEINE